MRLGSGGLERIGVMEKRNGDIDRRGFLIQASATAARQYLAEKGVPCVDG